VTRPFSNGGGGIAVELVQVKADLVAVSAERDYWREECLRAQAASTISASARRLRELQRNKPVPNQGVLIDE
jgi:hypothetical protein